MELREKLGADSVPQCYSDNPYFFSFSITSMKFQAALLLSDPGRSVLILL